MNRYPTLTKHGFHFPKTSGAAFSGASNGRRTRDWNPSDAGPNTTVTSALSTLRRRSRHLARNDPYGGSAINKLVSSIIGTGIRPQSRAPDADLAARIDRLWEDWVEETDTAGILDFYAQQALAVRSVCEGGECFVRLRTRRPEDGLTVPLQIQILESELVDAHYNQDLGARGHIRAGIQFDPIGRRVGYWMFGAHPSDNEFASTTDMTRRFVPADEVIHLYRPHRPGQIRGVPVLSGAILRLWGLDKFDDATLMRQEIASSFAGFVTRQPDEEGPDGANPLTGQAPDDTDGDDVPMVGLEAGTMQELQPGEDVKFSSPPDAGNTYPEFMRQQLLAVSARVGVPYEVLTGDMSNVNDRTLRGILLEFRRQVEQDQQQIGIHQFCRPIRRKFIDLAVLSGALDVSNYRRRRREVARTRWIPQGWKHIHPLQDVQADKEEVRAGFASRTQKVRERGGEAEAVDAENRQDNERAERNGLAYTSDGRYELGGDSVLAGDLDEGGEAPPNTRRNTGGN
jgi:lambda family phage portal protein